MDQGSQRPKLPPPRRRPDGAPTALGGTRIVDFTHFIAGPYCTQILADFGAEVIKIETAGSGDGFRAYPPSLQGESIPYLWTNRNKSSVALDLKTDAGRQLARDLIGQADIVVENFSTGVMRRFGLDYDSLAAANPRLIYCSISAYGREGAAAGRIGFDPIVQAESGFMSMNGFPGQEGVRAGPSIMDMATAMMSANAVMAALLARERSGTGQLVETTMIETAVTMLGNFSMAYLGTGEVPTRFGNTQPTACPVGSFETQDGAIYLACANDRTFRRFVTDVLDRPDLATDPRFIDSAGRRDNRDALMPVVAEALSRGTRDSLLARMHEAGVPAGAIRTVAEALDSPEVRSRGLLSEIPHPRLGRVPNVGLPVRLSATPPVDPVAAPELGAQTIEVLTGLLGLDPARIDALAAAGAFGPDSPAGRPAAAPAGEPAR
ncbi:MAG: CoA transferase [Sneathiellaceae bacterium]